MSAHYYSVTLSKQEEQQLKQVIGKGVEKARVITRARILLLANKNGVSRSDRQIADALTIGIQTPHRIRKRYHEEGFSCALYDAPRPGAPRKLTAEDEAVITAIACTDAPDGYDHWTCDLITQEVSSRQKKKFGRSTIHRVLLHHNLKPWRKKNVVHTTLDR